MIADDDEEAVLQSVNAVSVEPKSFYLAVKRQVESTDDAHKVSALHFYLPLGTYGLTL